MRFGWTFSLSSLYSNSKLASNH